MKRNSDSDDFLVCATRTDSPYGSYVPLRIMCGIYRDFDFYIQWGDELPQRNPSSNSSSSYIYPFISSLTSLSHVYATGGRSYVIRIFVNSNGRGFPGFRGCSDENGLSDALTYVHDLGSMKLTTLQEAFQNCTNLLSVRGGETSAVTSLENTFSNCINLENASIGHWDVSKVTSMYRTFHNLQRTTLDDDTTNSVLPLTRSAGYSYESSVSPDFHPHSRSLAGW